MGRTHFCALSVSSLFGPARRVAEDGPFLDEYDVFLADFERDEVRRVIDWVYTVLVSSEVEEQGEDAASKLCVAKL